VNQEQPERDYVVRCLLVTTSLDPLPFCCDLNNGLHVYANRYGNDPELTFRLGKSDERSTTYKISNIVIDTQESLRQFKAEFFQALAHPTRIAIVEQLRNGELSAGALIERLGIEQANASQHLAVLRAKNIVVNRKTGNQVSIPCAIR
jgi:hypothetical protein